jgi:hypothetical protein
MSGVPGMQGYFLMRTADGCAAITICDDEVGTDESTRLAGEWIVIELVDGLAEAHRLTFGPDPSTHSRCTLGGMIGNNSCGTHSLLAGKTVDNVEELRVLLYDGTELTVGATSSAEFEAIGRQGGRRADIYNSLHAVASTHAAGIRARFPQIPRRVSGYNLEDLLPERGFHVARSLVGSEGTCAIVLDAKVTLVRSPQHRSLVGLGYADAFEAADHVPEILEFKPIGLEGFEGAMVDGLRAKGAANLELLPEGRGILLVEFGSDEPGQAHSVAERLMRGAEAIARHARLANLHGGGIEGGLEAARVRPARRGQPAGHPSPLRRMGRCGRCAGEARAIPARTAPAARRLPVRGDVLRAFRARVHPHAGHVRPAERRGHSQVRDVRQRRGGPRRAPRRIRFGRARRRTVAQRAAAEDVRPEVMSALGAFKGPADPDNKLEPPATSSTRRSPSSTCACGRPPGPSHPADALSVSDDGGSMAAAAARCIGIASAASRTPA